MAGVPTNFQALSNVLANYDFVDIASGTGYINFYAGKTVDLRLLSNFTYYSDSILESDNPVVSNANTLVFDHDFDILLNRPLDLQGIGIVNLPISIQRGSDPSDTGYAYAVITLRKWTGSVETDIVSNTTTENSDAGDAGSTTSYHMTATDLNIPLTHFKKGEYIRLNIMLYGRQNDATGSTRVGYAHDPLNRSTGWDSTGAVPSKLTFQCPVRLNL